VDGNYDKIASTITDPVASSVPGNAGNDDWYHHIILWDAIREETVPSGKECGNPQSGMSACWLQAGVGMGYVGNSIMYALNANGIYEPYMEDFGAKADGTGSVYHVYFYPNIYLAEDHAVPVTVYWTGVYGPNGDTAKYEAWIEDINNQWNLLGTGYLYYAAAHARAVAEPYTNGSDPSDTCPTLTLGSPYQNFGTDSNGHTASADEIILTKSDGSSGAWSGSPNLLTDGQPHYWLTTTQTDWPARFMTNGPAGGPP
jgi:hypothetical protein